MGNTHSLFFFVRANNKKPISFGIVHDKRASTGILKKRRGRDKGDVFIEIINWFAVLLLLFQCLHYQEKLVWFVQYKTHTGLEKKTPC